jgi:hypothetical protein
LRGKNFEVPVIASCYYPVFLLVLADSKRNQIVDLATVKSENEIRIYVFFYALREVSDCDVASTILKDVGC